MVASVDYDDFTSFMRKVVLPRQAAHPDHVRLDGATAGGNWEVSGRFRHHGLVWTVYADTRYEPLALALAATEAGADPFVEEDTPGGRCLALTAVLRSRQQTPHKHLYIYLRSQAETLASVVPEPDRA